MRIFGIDPGSQRTGYGCVERIGSRQALVVCGSLSGPPRATFTDKLNAIHDGLTMLLTRHRPDCVAIEDVFRSAGFDRDEFKTLLITSDQVTQVLEDDRVKAATLTGSEPAGASVASTAAKQIKKSVLELGGSDPFIVMPTANLEEAVGVAVKARIVNNGQSCIAAKRFIVHESIANEFEKRFTAAMTALKVGDPMD